MHKFRGHTEETGKSVETIVVDYCFYCCEVRLEQNKKARSDARSTIEIGATWWGVQPKTAVRTSNGEKGAQPINSTKMVYVSQEYTRSHYHCRTACVVEIS